MQISEKGTEFIGRHEGFVSKTYPDPVGVPTIGFGFTNGSTAVRRHWGPVKFGQAMSRKEAENLLQVVIDEEYGPATIQGMPGANQHEFDMGCSGSFNVGPRIFKWKWAKAFRNGAKSTAVNLWKTTATTARGKKLPGLVRRRREEAAVLWNGDYGTGAMPSFTNKVDPAKVATEPAPPERDPILRDYQMKLTKLGYEPGMADGWMGPETENAVRAFQQKDPHLINDGILGRATMDSIDRHLEEGKTKRTVNWTTVGGAAATASTWFGAYDWMIYVAVGVVVVVGGYLLWRNRYRLNSYVLSFIR